MTLFAPYKVMQLDYFTVNDFWISGVSEFK